MALNTAYLNSGRTSSSDEVLTPFYAVTPILEYVPKNCIVWCPFDTESSAFVQTFKEHHINVIWSHKDTGKDFFSFEPDNYDLIISNPPYSIKDKVIERCYKLNKPFCLLLPVNSIQGKYRVSLFKQGLELLIFDLRVDYHTRGNLQSTTKGNHFGSAYFCNKFLPSSLIFKSLNKYDRPLI